jgi:hypothetical protein
VAGHMGQSTFLLLEIKMGGFICSNRTKTKISRNFGTIKQENIIIHCGSGVCMPNSFSNRLCWAKNAKRRWLLE